MKSGTLFGTHCTSALSLFPFRGGNKVGRIGAWELGFSELRHLFFWSEESEKVNFPMLIRDPWYVTLRLFNGCFAYLGTCKLFVCTCVLDHKSYRSLSLVAQLKRLLTWSVKAISFLTLILRLTLVLRFKYARTRCMHL